MSTKLFVGGLPFVYSNTELTALFSGMGRVVSAEMVFDPDRGRTRGFGFVEMDTPEEAEAAIAGLNGTKVGEKNIYVTQAREKPAPRQAPGARNFPKVFNRKVGRSPRDRAADPAPPAQNPGRPAWPPPRPERPFDKPPRRYKGSKPFSHRSDAPPAFGSSTGPQRPGFSDKRSFSGPRRERGDFGKGRPSGKPPKKEFWRKFEKKPKEK
jgi:RNA recognition motif-containing protein